MGEQAQNGQKKKGSLRTLINVLDIFIYTLKDLSVEFVIFLVYLGWIFGSTLQSPGIYRRICEFYYTDDADVDCYRITDTEIEDEVQMRNAEWSLFSALAYFIPAIIADTILGAYGDRHGRKFNILLGLMGITVSEFGYLLVLSDSVKAPYWTVLIFGVAAGMTGFFAMIPVSCNAYLADITEDSDILTIRSGIFSVFMLLASVIGAVVAAFVNWLKIVIAIDIELGLYLIAFLFVLWRIPQKPGPSELERRSSSSVSTKVFLLELWQLLKKGFCTYKRSRLGHRRAFIFITVLVLMITYTTSVETRMSLVMNSYVFRRTDENSLQWNQRDLGFWNGSGYLILIIGTLIGLFFFKQVMNLRETTIMLIALASNIARTVMIAFATEWWYMYVANACGLFGSLLQPALVSFMVQIIPENEIGQIFSLFGIGGDLAFIITYLIYNNIYRATQDWMPGFLFLFIGGVQVVAFIAMLWVHVQSIIDGIGKQPPFRPQDIRTAISIIGEETPPPTPTTPLPPSSPVKKISIYEHALARRDARNALIEEEWWQSLTDVRQVAGSLY